jgi:hypothetical protein
VFKQLCYGIPSTVQHEAIVPVDVFVVEVRCKEYMRHDSINWRNLRLRNTASTQDTIDFNSVSVLDRASGYLDRLVKEAIQIRLNHKNFNRDNGFTLSRAWNPITKLLFKHDADPGKAANESAH